MSEILLFHHTLGRTPGFVAWADALRQAGYAMHPPDLFEGQVFDRLEDGVAHARRIGFEGISERGVEPRTSCRRGRCDAASAALLARRVLILLESSSAQRHPA